MIDTHTISAKESRAFATLILASVTHGYIQGLWSIIAVFCAVLFCIEAWRD